MEISLQSAVCGHTPPLVSSRQRRREKRDKCRRRHTVTGTALHCVALREEAEGADTAASSHVSSHWQPLTVSEQRDVESRYIQSAAISLC